MGYLMTCFLIEKGKPDGTTMVKCISEIVAALIKAHEEGKTVNMSTIKSRFSAKYGLAEQPKTVEIIAAIPEQWKDALLPSLKTKPVRTASGVSRKE
jgi:elongator complex protein 3